MADGTGGTITKIGMDATIPAHDRERFERVRYKNVDLNDYVITGPLPDRSRVL
jgi:hypothetical protein